MKVVISEGFIWVFRPLYTSRVPKMERSWQRGGGRLNCRSEMRIGDPSFFAVGRALGLHHQTVQRCVERAVAEGPLAASTIALAPAGNDDHAGGQGMAGVAGMPESEGPRLSPRAVDDGAAPS